MEGLEIRTATSGDLKTLVEFNRLMAWETESKKLDENLLSRGIQAVLEDPRRGFYLVASQSGRVIGQLMITFEWSDWRNGLIWWFQSVYVHEDCRRRGVFAALFAEVRRLAREDPEVIGLRLYVENANERAIKTYLSLGMEDAGYRVIELLG